MDRETILARIEWLSKFAQKWGNTFPELAETAMESVRILKIKLQELED